MPAMSTARTSRNLRQLRSRFDFSSNCKPDLVCSVSRELRESSNCEVCSGQLVLSCVQNQQHCQSSICSICAAQCEGPECSQAANKRVFLLHARYSSFSQSGLNIEVV